jgi:hypothetical protein
VPYSEIATLPNVVSAVAGPAMYRPLLDTPESVTADEHVNVPTVPLAAKTIVPTTLHDENPEVHCVIDRVVEAVAAVAATARLFVHPEGIVMIWSDDGRKYPNTWLATNGAPL